MNTQQKYLLGLGGLGALTAIVLVAKSSSKLPSLVDPALRGKVEGAIMTMSDPTALRQLADGLKKQGGEAEAAKAENKAAALETAVAAQASAAQVTAMIPALNIPGVISTGPGSISVPRITHATLRQGSTGPEVMLWQTVLALAPDGIFGPATKTGTIAFQKAHGLSADGVVGPATWLKAGV